MDINDRTRIRYVVENIAQDEASADKFGTDQLAAVVACFVYAIQEASKRDFDFDNYFSVNYVDTFIHVGTLNCMVNFAAAGKLSWGEVRPLLVQFVAKHSIDIRWMLLYYSPIEWRK